MSKLFNLLFGVQKTIKLKEYVKGLYRYPKKMIGRNVSYLEIDKTDILVFAAHPDDELLGLSVMINRHRLKGEKVVIVYVTDGTGRDGDSWKRDKELSEQVAKIRYQEGINGLSVLQVPQQNLFCLGFPDGGTHRYLKEISKDVIQLINKLLPEKIYVHCIEGGHNDHDLVSLVVKSVCHKLNFVNIFEWAEYNSFYPLGSKKIEFLPSLDFHKKQTLRKIDLSEIELKKKQNMLACHVSQNIGHLFSHNEIIRRADLMHFKKELLAYSQVPKEDWFPLIEKFLKYMGRNHFHTSLLNTLNLRKQDIKRI